MRTLQGAFQNQNVKDKHGKEAGVKGDGEGDFKRLSDLKKKKLICLEEQIHRAVWKPKKQNRS